MNRSLGIALSLLVGLGSASAANASIFVYTGLLTGAAESPPTGSPGTGTAIVTYDDFAHTLHVQVSFSDLVGTTAASHIHVRDDPSALSGGVATTVPTFVGFPLGVTSGTYDSVLDLTLSSSYNPAFVNSHGGTVASAEAALANALATGRSYLNVHTNLFPGGEIRANLAVPEPASWTMMLLGFGLMGYAFRRRERAVPATA